VIKNNLSILLGQRRMKMSELAEKAGLNKNTILNLYHAKSTRIEFTVMEKLCAALNCQPGDIFEYVSDK